LDVTAAIIINNNRFLSAKRSSGKHLADHWGFPGSKFEPGETPEQCLKRGLKEEFTIESEIGEFVAESTFDYGDKCIRLLAYKVKHLSGEFQLIDYDEIRWFLLMILSLKTHLIYLSHKNLLAYYYERMIRDVPSKTQR
jgi:8-oxo-dGTP diphosphatase